MPYGELFLYHDRSEQEEPVCILACLKSDNQRYHLQRF